MNKFEKQLEKWNNGILRGAQSKLAKRLHVSTATVALWATGRRHPSKGYVAKMAQLFKLDVYDVARLFAAGPVYPLSAASNHPSGLQDAESLDMHYRVHNWPSAGATVSLPVFSRVPYAYPHYAPADVQDWWILPPDAAQEAQFLFLLPTPDDLGQLLFIKPSTTWVKNKLMLARRQDTYCIVRVSTRRNQTVLLPVQGKLPPAKELEPIGIIVRRVTKPC